MNIKKLTKPSNLGYLLITACALVGAIATGGNFSIIQSLERQTQSAFLKLRGSVNPPSNITILAIDEQSLSQGAFYDPKKRPFLEPLQAWPWKRAAYAQVIDRVMTAGAKAVAVDVLFANKSIYGAEDDAEFQRILDKYAGRVILASSFEASNSLEASTTQIVTPTEVYRLTPNSVGFVNFMPESNGYIHRLGNQFANKLGLGESMLPFAEATLKAARLDYVKPQGSDIFFFGPSNTWLASQQQIPFFQVLDPSNWQNQVLKNGEYFKGKIVLIGATAASLQDIQPSPWGSMPGIEIHANAIATLVENRSIKVAIPDNTRQSLFVLIIVLATGIILSFVKRPVVQFLASLGVATAWGIACYLSFTYASLILPTAVPVAAIILSGLALLTTGTLTAQIDKLVLRRTLERYVAAPIVKEIINQPDDFRALLEGRNLKAVVLFSDIRGFTTLASKMPAAKLIQQLNSYLSCMVDVILDAQGTVDKFIGDAIMAEFGSPVSYGEKTDAMNAIHAALNMRTALIELRRQWQAEGQIPFFNGIGINYGEVTVGNIGSARRLEYAVIGDTVNVASRVEGLTKELCTDILITETLYEIVSDEVEVVDLGAHTIRGRSGQIKLYSLIGLKGSDSSLHRQVQADMQRHMGVIDLLKLGKLPPTI